MTGASIVKSPTGVLRLIIEGGSGTREIADEDGHLLETRLNLVFENVFKAVVGEREAERRRAEWRRQRELEQARREEEERRRRELARRAEEERQRRVALATEASNWQEAGLIRNYVAHVMGTSDLPVAPALLEWGKWALQVAAELDPTERRCAREQPSEHDGGNFMRGAT